MRDGGIDVQVQIALTLPRDALSVPLARHTVSAALERAGVTEDCRAEVELAISEACTNAYYHAATAATYEVQILVDEQQLRINVIDEGGGFGDHAPALDMPDPSADSGRGMALMTALTDHAVFDSVSGGGGQVHLMKRLRWSNDAPALRPAQPNLRALRDDDLG